VILLGLDGFPLEALSPELTPHLWALGASGGRAPAGGQTALPSTTYPGFATLLTGRLPPGHGVWSTNIGRAAPAWAGQSQVGARTLFDACRAAGLRSAAIQGDHLLHTVLQTTAASLRWPPDGVIPPGTPRETHGYPSDAAVRPHLLEAVADRTIGFVFGHLNETDSLGHDHGPADPRTLACCAQADAIVGNVVQALGPDWPRTVVVVVSDHDQEPRTDRSPIDLLADQRVAVIADDVWPDGGAALVHLRPGVEHERAAAVLECVDGVDCSAPLGPEVLVVGAVVGHLFRAPGYAAGGFHGGPTTARTLALVGGGHPAVPRIAAAIAAHPPHLADWAPTIATVLGLDGLATDGRDLTTAA
jgi:arylsulfatase A-like enzyme